MRGNPVMKAKRVTGPTPNAVLCNRLKLERCYVKGCENPVTLVRDVELHSVKRCCSAHIDGLTATQRQRTGVMAGSSGIGWSPPWIA